MKAKDLIEYLSKVDPDLDIVIGLPSWGVFTPLIDRPYNKIVYLNAVTGNYVDSPRIDMSNVCQFIKKEVVII